MKIDTLKQQAREHELAEEWGKALALYRKAVDALGEAEEPDIALLNRMADLQVRSGNLEGALESYGEAIELYLEADLPNNAIAICRKMIRNAPDRPEVFRRMGEIRAKQGFVVDARQSYLTFAEMMEARGNRDEALAGLQELVTLLPDDAETRLFLGEQLAARGEVEDGLPHLLHARRVLKRKGEEERVGELEERIRALDPEADLAEPAGADPSEPRAEDGAGDALFGFQSTDLSGDSDGAEGAGPTSTEVEDFEDFGHTFDDSFGDGVDAAKGTDDPVTGRASPTEAAPVEGDPYAPESSDVEEEEAEAILGSFELALEDDEEPVEAEGGTYDDTARLAEESPEDPEGFELADAGDREEFEDLEDEVPEWAEPLPLLESDGSFGFGDASPEEMDTLSAIRERVGEAPDDPDRHEELVAYAYRTNDRGLLLEAFVALAGAFDRIGAETKARAVYEQALQLDPHHPGALEALGRGGEPATPDVEVDPGSTADDSGSGPDPSTGRGAGAQTDVEEGVEDVPPPPGLETTTWTALDGAASGASEGGPVEAEADSPPESAGAPKPPGEGFIDLGSLVMDEEVETTTRWVAAGHEPSGDEGEDFASLLSDFKSKVARNLDHEDSRAQYDLGAAYKEMGLLDEAIAMFQSALRARPDHLGAIEMMGQCFLEKGDPRMAVRVLSRALVLPHPVEDELLGIYYYLGDAHEQAGNPEEAREFYEKVFALDINFKDVTDRLRGLR